MPRVDVDLIIVGGGIHGAGVARDAARRGLNVSLFERGDFGSATSSASSKLVHGGLRYLEQLRVRLVRESLVERSALLRIAGHLVRPLPFLAPIYDGAPRGRAWMKLGLSLYDLLAAGHSLGHHEWLDAREVLELEPALDPAGLRGAFRFHDAQMNDARLCLENVLSARHHGAQVRNYTAVDDLVVEGDEVTGVLTRNGQAWRARAVVLTVGTFLGGRILVGESEQSGGRVGDPASIELAERLRALGYLEFHAGNTEAARAAFVSQEELTGFFGAFYGWTGGVARTLYIFYGVEAIVVLLGGAVWLRGRTAPSPVKLAQP